ncbi:dTDP-4-dehydrorhamnose reductase [Planctomycetota bacterium]
MRNRKSMRILVTGAQGMLGRTLMRQLGAHEVTGVDVDDFDITDAAATHAAVVAAKPAVVVHCAAMTAVDGCESAADLAYQVNALGSANVASATARAGARLIAISTDYVFRGDLDRPYHEWDCPDPVTVYGASKLAGEDAVRDHCPNHLIVRIAWLYGPGGPSFVHTMLRLGAEDGAPLKVVDDQRGNPTSTIAVAEHLAQLIELPLAGMLHLTCEGDTTWYGLTQEIFRLAGLSRDLLPCTTAEFPRPAPRPANSRLENRALRLHRLPPMPHWREALAVFLQEYPRG